MSETNRTLSSQYVIGPTKSPPANPMFRATTDENADGNNSSTLVHSPATRDFVVCHPFQDQPGPRIAICEMLKSPFAVAVDVAASTFTS